MTDLSEALQEEMPIDRVVASCGVCEIELYDSAKEPPEKPFLTGEIIKIKASKHRKETGHNDLQVGVDKPVTTKVKEIDCTVTVNG